MAWKAEAFALWRTIWADAYDEDSETRALLYDIHDTYFLVSVVDNDFVSGDIWRVFAEAALEGYPEVHRSDFDGYGHFVEH